MTMTTEITIPSTCHLPAHKRKQAKAAINRAIALASLQAMEGQPMRLEADVYHGIRVQYVLKTNEAIATVRQSGLETIKP